MKKVLLLHGAFEHAGRYDHVMQYLQAQGFDVCAPTFRGHGAAGGKCVHIDDIAEYVADTRAALDARGWPQPDVVLAHSMGGLVALTGLLQGAWKPQRVIVMSPFLDTPKPIPSAVLALARGLDKIVPGGLCLPTGVQGRYLTHDPDMRAAHAADPHIRKRLSVRWYVAIRKAQKQLMAVAHTLHTPLAILSAGQDRVVSLSRQYDFVKQLPQGVLITHHVYPDAYHELLNETNRMEVLEDITELLNME